MLENNLVMESAKLIIDIADSDEMPCRFRIIRRPDDIFVGSIDMSGIDCLRISGSGVFSRRGLLRLKEMLNQKKLIIVDTRQESHGYVNGMSVSMYGPYNYANRNQSPAEVQRMERELLQSLAASEEILFDHWEGKSVPVAEPITDIDSVLSEEELVRAEGIGYWRFYVTDHHGPSDTEIDQFILRVCELEEHTWLHFHCRGGVGRTTTFLIMYDMIRNAKVVSCEDIIRRQHLMGGRDMYRLAEGTHKFEAAVARLKTIELFYHYCKENEDQFATSFSNWKVNHKARN